jgi:rhodanese-related sulfurtransferase
MRSGSAANILKANGFENVVNGGPWDRVAEYVK